MIWCAAIDDYKDMFEWWDWNEYGSWRREEPGQKVEETWLHLPLTFKIPHEWNPSQRHDNVTRLDVFDLQSYHDSEEVQGCTMHLRYVSPEVKIELERTFIFTHAFRFLCPTLLDHFLNQLLAHHRLLLRSINLRIFGCYDSYSCGQNSIESECRAWVAVIERLPATLQFVTFELGWLGVRLFNPGLWGTRMSRDIRTTMKAVALLEVLTKKIQRQAPNAKVSLAGLDWLCVEDREMLQTMLDEVGPHSEEFKKWLVQTRKNAMD